MTHNHIGWTLEKWKKTGERNKGIPIVYIIKVFDEVECFIKIGKTYKNVDNRFKENSWKLPYCFEIIKIIDGSYDDVFLLEKTLIKDFSKYRYIPNKKFNGKTECFTMDVLKLITNK